MSSYIILEKYIETLKPNRLHELSDSEINSIIRLSNMNFSKEEKEALHILIPHVPYIKRFIKRSFGEPVSVNNVYHSYLDQIIYRLEYYGKYPEASTMTSKKDLSVIRKPRKLQKSKTKKSPKSKKSISKHK
jgi:hypothetical protein